MPKVSEGHKEARRLQIIDAANACFARKGFHQATIEDICKEAELSPGAIYLHFAGKEDIVEAAVLRHQGARAARIAAAQETNDFSQTWEALFRGQIRRFDAPPEQSDVGLWMQLFSEAQINPRIARAVRQSWEDALARVAEIVQLGQTQGVVDSSVNPRTASLLLSIIHDGLMVQKAIYPEMTSSELLEALDLLFPGRSVSRSFLAAGRKE